MHTITRQIRRLAILFTILTTIVAAMPLSGSAQDTTDDLKEQCKNGGWQTLTDANGDPFANQGACVSYIATGGGTFIEPPSTQAPWLEIFTWTDEHGACWYTAVLQNADPEKDYQLTARGSDPWSPGGVLWSWDDGSEMTNRVWETVWPVTFTVEEWDWGTGPVVATVVLDGCGA